MYLLNKFLLVLLCIKHVVELKRQIFKWLNIFSFVIGAFKKMTTRCQDIISH